MLLYLFRKVTFKVLLALTLNSLGVSSKIISLSVSFFRKSLLLLGVELLIILGVSIRVRVRAIVIC